MSSKLLLCLMALCIPVSAFAGQMLYTDAVEAYNNALKEQRAGNYEKSLADYKRALMLMSPDEQGFRKFVLNNSALMALNQGETDQAEVLWQQALELDPKYKLAAENLGLLYVRKGEPDKAIKIWMTAFDFPQAYNLEPEKKIDDKGVISNQRR